MLNELLTLLNKANADYLCTYSSAQEMNLKADTINRDKGFAYVEEYRNGTHDYSSFLPTERTNVSIFFCRLCEFGNDAIEREQIINRIKNEIVIPFEKAYNESGIFSPCNSFQWRTITPADAQFDANEVGLVLTFTAEQKNTCIGEWR